MYNPETPTAVTSASVEAKIPKESEVILDEELTEEGVEGQNRGRVETNGIENLPEGTSFNEDEAQKQRENSQEQVLVLDTKLNNLYDELNFAARTFGAARQAGIEPDVSVQQALIAQIDGLEGEKRDWVDQYGTEALPEGIVIEEDDGSFSQELHQSVIEKSMTPEERRAFINDWKKTAVQAFQKGFEKGRGTKDALNLSQVVEFGKHNIPLMLEKQSKDFLDGKTEYLPDFIQWNYKMNSLWDRISGRPNQITDLKFSFGSETITVQEEDIVPEEEEANEDSGAQNQANPQTVSSN